MRLQALLELVVLAALWGGSFLLMRIAAPEFGAVALVLMRVGVAALLLWPWVMLRRQGAQLRRHFGAVSLVGIVNSALPFLAFAYAALGLSAGFSSILNSTSPMWAALVALLVWRVRLHKVQMLGLLLGFVGVLWLAWDKAGTRGDGVGAGLWLAITVCLLAPLCYGIGANLVQRRLQGVPPLVTAAGSQIASTLFCLPLLWWFWPAAMPSPKAWAAAIVLGALCTGAAYVLYFRLIAHWGSAKAISVTYLIPLFGIGWGALVLAEPVTLTMLLAGAVIVAGTALSIER
jgi:drug/metabolite transporter (DMT)-like permease